MNPAMNPATTSRTDPAIPLGAGTASGDGRRLRYLLLSEWTKAASLRSSAATIALTLVTAIGLGALICSSQGRQYAEMTPDARAAFDPTRTSLMGGIVMGQLPLGTLGALLLTSEYATGTIRGTFTAAPRRSAVLAAKAVLAVAVGIMIGEACMFGTYLIGQRMLARAGVPHTALDQPHVLRAVLGAGLVFGLVGLLGLALATLVRATAGALTALVTITLLVPLLSPVLPAALARWWPGSAGWEITRVVPNPEPLAPWTGFAVFAGMVGAVLLAGFAVLGRRDA